MARDCLTAEQVDDDSQDLCRSAGCAHRRAAVSRADGGQRRHPGRSARAARLGGFWNNPEKPDEPQRLDFFRYWVVQGSELGLAQVRLERRCRARWTSDSAGPSTRTTRTSRASRRGAGSCMMFMGWQDPVGAAPEAINYYEGVVARSAAGTPAARHAETQSFLRLYMIPGMAHCRLGPGATFFTSQMRRSLPPVEDARHDMVQALHEWVERGTPPQSADGHALRQSGFQGPQDRVSTADMRLPASGALQRRAAGASVELPLRGCRMGQGSDDGQ